MILLWSLLSVPQVPLVDTPTMQTPLPVSTYRRPKPDLAFLWLLATCVESANVIPLGIHRSLLMIPVVSQIDSSMQTPIPNPCTPNP